MTAKKGLRVTRDQAHYILYLTQIASYRPMLSANAEAHKLVRSFSEASVLCRKLVKAFDRPWNVEFLSGSSNCFPDLSGTLTHGKG